MIEVHNPNLAAYVEHYVDNLSLDKLLVQLQEYLKQVRNKPGQLRFVSLRLDA